MNNSTTVDPSRWDEVSPLIGGFILRPYAELQKDPYYALPGFYAGERDGFPILAFQPGWDGVDGEEAVHWRAPWPTVAQAREAIASSLLSSWLVQDRDDAADFFLGDEPGSIGSPWGLIPSYVLFARRNTVGDDAPWENLRSILADVDAALEAGAPEHGGFVDWRLRNGLSASVKTKFSKNPDSALAVVFRIRGNDWDVPVFLWNADGTPRGGEVEEYEPDGAVGLYESYPLRNEADLDAFLALAAR